MIKIIESKQVGPLSYCVSINSPEVLYDIIANERIQRSRNPEYNTNKSQNQHYVSFSRDLTSHAKKSPNKWGIGVIVDGDVLSNKYKIQPISFTNNNFYKGAFYIRDLNRYDNGTCTVSFTDFSTMPINRRCYDELENVILNLPDDVKEKANITHWGAGRKRLGKARVDGYHVPGGRSVKVTANDVSDYVINYISKHTDLNETEERIWVIKGNYVDISGAIIGTILPKKWKSEYENPNVDTELGLKLQKIKEFNYPVTWY